jgi:hypothetical protein
MAWLVLALVICAVIRTSSPARCSEPAKIASKEMPCSRARSAGA